MVAVPNPNSGPLGPRIFFEFSDFKESGNEKNNSIGMFTPPAFGDGEGGGCLPGHLRFIFVGRNFCVVQGKSPRPKPAQVFQRNARIAKHTEKQHLSEVSWAG